jgi:hypothetical protein|tara:strand:- start:31 stop:240 length:210 start_codon:yes stop_codon:yes gene_type:complete
MTPATTFDPSVALSKETWNLARMITESPGEAEDLVQTICRQVVHLPNEERSMAVTFCVNLLASKVMTRH